MSFLNPQGINTDNQQIMSQENQEGVESQDITTGDGETAEAGDTLTVHYVGTLTDGRVFDSSVDRGTPFVFTLGVGQVIRGWDEGMEGMRVGGRRLLVIPSEYAYGPNDVGSIPANSTLIFEVELLDVETGQ
jgi:FKBP-type peptidyl-prolyl cis-trans isomerase